MKIAPPRDTVAGSSILNVSTGHDVAHTRIRQQDSISEIGVDWYGVNRDTTDLRSGSRRTWGSLAH
eukprot:714953-Rhodomonas_salina.2